MALTNHLTMCCTCVQRRALLYLRYNVSGTRVCISSGVCMRLWVCIDVHAHACMHACVACCRCEDIQVYGCRSVQQLHVVMQQHMRAVMNVFVCWMYERALMCVHTGVCTHMCVGVLSVCVGVSICIGVVV